MRARAWRTRGSARGPRGVSQRASGVVAMTSGIGFARARRSVSGRRRPANRTRSRSSLGACRRRRGRRPSPAARPRARRYGEGAPSSGRLADRSSGILLNGVILPRENTTSSLPQRSLMPNPCRIAPCSASPCGCLWHCQPRPTCTSRAGEGGVPVYQEMPCGSAKELRLGKSPSSPHRGVATPPDAINKRPAEERQDRQGCQDRQGRGRRRRVRAPASASRGINRKE